MCALCEAAYVQVPCSANVSIEKNWVQKMLTPAVLGLKKEDIFSTFWPLHLCQQR